MAALIRRTAVLPRLLRIHNTSFTRNIVDDLEKTPRLTFTYNDIHKIPYEERNPFQEKPPPEKYTDVEISTAEWEFVERLIPPLVIPEPPPTKQRPLPSGWQAPAETRPDLPYYVRRTRNHMMPVYLKVKNAGTRVITVVKGVEGNIWELEKQLRTVAEMQNGQMVMTSIDEPGQRILLKGDFVSAVRQWLERSGF